MRIPSLRTFCLAAILLPLAATGAGLPPWQFGMTKEQVVSFKQFGPYRTFKNGDPETFNGMYRGQRHNVQFYFENNRLIRIAVSLGEGTDRDKGIATFRQAYGILQKDYGSVKIPELHVTRGSEPVPIDAMAIAAAANAFVTGHTHIIPLKQPRDMRVSGQIMSWVTGSERLYGVVIDFDPR
jgi:hypothetical protein